MIPTLHVRVGDRLYVHGSPGSRMLKAMAGGVEVCVTVTLIDGLVLARSAFHHSMNYRSAVVFGTAQAGRGPRGEGPRAPRAVGAPGRGRWADIRGPAPGELKATTILSLPIDEASAKVRTGPPLDDEEDYEAIAAWAGVVPLSMRAGEPIACPRLAPGIEPPPYARSYPGPGEGAPGG